ncbi:DUF4271 domain-containing protein [Nonlabens sp. Ci31]|uniref:DUF4271 domain-containing protein n=1 Tax=Nonlabens sp. Ci31 TaxID=2608253 RepID=UPI001463653B|nr:DUF4271 domain-containing protein [Nonlabens sp. Ci31]QJP33511.1 DUF4271 domain-containing protein [Nonlabens sp. Ci31]
MHIELRHMELNDWISITLLFCVLILAVARWFSKFHITDLLSCYFKDRFIKLSRNGEEGSSVLITGNVVVYTINIALFIYVFYQKEKQLPIEINGFLLSLTFLSVFFLTQHFIGKLIATLCNFEQLLIIVDHHRNIYRAMFAYPLLIINCIIIYLCDMNETALLTSLIIIGFVLFVYHLILIYTYRSLLFSAHLYFILYLCALEITPYLLLYKYFML